MFRNIAANSAIISDGVDDGVDVITCVDADVRFQCCLVDS